MGEACFAFFIDGAQYLRLRIVDIHDWYLKHKMLQKTLVDNQTIRIVATCLQVLPN